jgi:YD repeat-containing protein
MMLLTRYYYDGDSTRVLYETDGSNNLLVRYIYDQNGQIVSMVRGGITYFYHYNYRGDVVALTNSSGTVVAEYDYDAYGVPVATGLEGSVVNTFRYADTGGMQRPGYIIGMPGIMRLRLGDLLLGMLFMGLKVVRLV